MVGGMVERERNREGRALRKNRAGITLCNHRQLCVLVDEGTRKEKVHAKIVGGIFVELKLPLVRDNDCDSCIRDKGTFC